MKKLYLLAFLATESFAQHDHSSHATPEPKKAEEAQHIHEAEEHQDHAVKEAKKPKSKGQTKTEKKVDATHDHSSKSEAGGEHAHGTAAPSSEHNHEEHRDHSTAKPEADAQHDHSSMSSGADPSDLRDPHEHSNGYTQHSNPYLDKDMATHAHSGDALFSALLVERLEQAVIKDEKPVTQYEAEAWVGTSFEKLVLRSEGEITEGKLEESENELLWAHAISPYWDSTLGLRYDAGDFPGRAYAALGIRGIAPYWFETSANLYVSDEGQLAINAETEYEIVFTQRLILTPRLEVDITDLLDRSEIKDSHSRVASFGLRLRYEIYRRFAPYIGVETKQYFGPENDEDETSSQNSGLVGVKFWF